MRVTQQSKDLLAQSMAWSRSRSITSKYPYIQSLMTSGRASLNEVRECVAKKFIIEPYTASAIQSAVEAVLSV